MFVFTHIRPDIHRYLYDYIVDFFGALYCRYRVSILTIVVYRVCYCLCNDYVIH